MMHMHCAAIFQKSEGRFLRLCAELDIGGVADDAWRYPAMHGE
jgi:hypothetical protein